MSTNFIPETPLPVVDDAVSPDHKIDAGNDVIDECDHHAAADSEIQISTRSDNCGAPEASVAAGPSDDDSWAQLKAIALRYSSSPDTVTDHDDRLYVPRTVRERKSEINKMNVPIYIDILRTKEVPELQVAVSGIDFSNTNSVVIVQHPDDASVKLLAERMCPWVNTFVLVNYYMYHAKVLKLEHPHISRIVGFARTTGGEPILLFPHAEDLTLKDHVEKWSVSMTDRLKYMRDILSALIYMHSGRNGVKFAKGAFSENSILINSENKAYFTNWCSNFSEHTMSKVTIPPECMAKDCGPDEWFGDFGLESDRDVQCRGDMWYFGLILLRMTVGYEGWSEVVRLIKNRKRPDCPDNVDKWLWDLIVDGCLIPDVSRRIGDKYAMLLVDNLIKRGELAEWPRKLRRKSLFTTIGLWLGYAVGTAINVIARKCLWKFMLSRSIKNWYIAMPFSFIYQNKKCSRKNV